MKNVIFRLHWFSKYLKRVNVFIFLGHCGGKSCPSGGYLDKDCKCMCKGSPIQECSGNGDGGNGDGGNDGGGGGEGEHIMIIPWNGQGQVHFFRVTGLLPSWLSSVDLDICWPE